MDKIHAFRYVSQRARRYAHDILPSEHVEYKHVPAPPDVVPPVGDRHMMLLPEFADEDRVCLSGFPKKNQKRYSHVRAVSIPDRNCSL